MNNRKTNINQTNYEAYLTDYLDGRLTENEIQELKTFFLVYPDLAGDLEDLKKLRLTPPVIKYSGKTALYRNIIHECEDYYEIALTENAPEPQDLLIVQKKSAIPEFQKKVLLYSKVKLHPDPQIYYPYKKKLYRKSQVGSLYLLSGIAAIVLLFIGIFAIWQHFSTAPDPSLFRRESLLSVKVIYMTTENTPIPRKTIEFPKKMTRKKNVLISNQAPILVTQKEVSTIQIINLPVPPVEYADNLPVPELQTLPQIHMPQEILLSVEAENWKPSRQFSQSEDIFTSFIQAGKNLAEKIKNKQISLFPEESSNKSESSDVIQ